MDSLAVTEYENNKNIYFTKIWFSGFSISLVNFFCEIIATIKKKINIIIKKKSGTTMKMHKKS